MSGSGIGYALGGWVYFIKRGDGVRIKRRDGGLVTIGTDDQAGCARGAERQARLIDNDRTLRRLITAYMA